jgi:lysophospholipase L1-like esterase
MAKYKIIPSSRTIVQSPISIGHKAEKGVEAIEFDLTAWVETYGSGTLTVIMRRWGDAIPYPIALEIDENNKATWTLSDTDTAKAGMAYAQLNYIVGDEVVKKSDIYTFRVMDSLTGEGEPPEAYESWLEHLTHLAAEAMAEVLDIEGIVTDKTLTIDGGIADGKATGDALALKADKSTTYTKTEVDQMIEDVEVETDTTLEIAGAPADAAETGRQIGLLKADLGVLESITVNEEFTWSSVGSSTYPTGFRTGYIDTTGASKSSNVYIRSMLIPSEKLKGYGAVKLTPPSGYFVWATIFLNDYVGESNFVAQYGDYSKQEIDKEIFFPIKDGQSMVVSVGRFPQSSASQYLTDEFTTQIKCKLYLSQTGEKSPYIGKKMSLLGDSISAHVADIPEGNKAYYTGENMGVGASTDMWYRVLCNDLGMEPLVVNGWSGSCVTSGVRPDTTYLPASSPSRCEALHEGSVMPDVILIAMGVNDYSYMDSANEFGTWDGTTALGESADFSDYDISTFRTAYATMLARIKKKYPNALIVCITPWFVQRKTTDTGATYLNAIGLTENAYANAVKDIAGLMGCKAVDGTNIGFNRYNFYPTFAQDSATIPTHPNATGHAYMGHAIAKEMMTLLIPQ